jgi:uncharacterized protein (DUF433 family)
MDHPRIERDPAVMVGKPVIRGTRITVDHILRDVASGISFAEIANAYPRISVADVQAAVACAADFVTNEGLVSA